MENTEQLPIYYLGMKKESFDRKMVYQWSVSRKQERISLQLVSDL